VAILTDCCTTVNEVLHLIALHAVSTRVPVVESRTVPQGEGARRYPRYVAEKQP
jgi:hypothetical protein